MSTIGLCKNPTTLLCKATLMSAAVALVFTRKWQLHQQATDPPVTIHLVNQLQQLLLGD